MIENRLIDGRGNCACREKLLHAHVEAVHAGDIVGHLMISARELPYGQSAASRTYAEIRSIRVTESYRGRGVGTRLCTDALDWADENGFTHVAVESSYEGVGPIFYRNMQLGWMPRSIIWDLEL